MQQKLPDCRPVHSTGSPSEVRTGRLQKGLPAQSLTFQDGFSLLSDRQIDKYVDLYLSLIDARMLTFIEDKDGNLIAAGVSIPSLSRALQKCNGEIFPFGWWHLLKAMFLKKPDTLDLLLIGVEPEWQSKGVVALLFMDLFQTYRKLGFKYAETNAMLEDNVKIQSMFAPFEKELHKRRWIFGKEI